MIIFQTVNLRMAVPPLLSGLMDKHGDTLQQAALLVYLKQGDSQYLEV